MTFKELASKRFFVRKYTDKPINKADINLGIAVEHLCLAAADRGLGSCWV